MLIRRNGRFFYRPRQENSLVWGKSESLWKYPLIVVVIGAVFLIAELMLIKHYQPKQIEVEKAPITIVQTVPMKIVARMTGYSPEDSCHNKNAKGQCLAANGKVAQRGDAACPHWLKLGTRFVYRGFTYTCNDRTADWVQQKWVRTPTFDIFHDSCAKQACGVESATIEILGS